MQTVTLGLPLDPERTVDGLVNGWVVIAEGEPNEWRSILLNEIEHEMQHMTRQEWHRS